MENNQHKTIMSLSTSEYNFPTIHNIIAILTPPHENALPAKPSYTIS